MELRTTLKEEKQLDEIISISKIMKYFWRGFDNKDSKIYINKIVKISVLQENCLNLINFCLNLLFILFNFF
jgi:hypothetical protein